MVSPSLNFHAKYAGLLGDAYVDCSNFGVNNIKVIDA